MAKSRPYPASSLFTYAPQKIYRGKKLLQIAFPLGGIGAGCICFNGQGGLQDFSIRHRPANSAAADTFEPQDAAFALLHIPESGITRLVEGPFPEERIYDQGLKSQGYRGGGFEGLPRFQHCTFQGEYPFGQAFLSDEHIPLKVTITGFNPLIPLDVKNSAIPCAILEYTLTNASSSSINYQFSYHLSHLAPGTGPWDQAISHTSLIPGRGVFFYNEEAEDIAANGSASLSVIGYQPAIKQTWFRGSWFDAVSALWKEVSQGTLTPDSGNDGTKQNGRNGASILLNGTLEPGQSITYPILITWHFPNVPYASGNVSPEMLSAIRPEKYDPRAVRCWRPYYATQWRDAREVENYVQLHYSTLRERTQAFHDALFNSTFPDYVLEAISANLAILKSPTILLQEDGNLWGWEGCFPDRGSCSGSCTHVWNYAQSIAHLFPQLERTLRDQEYRFSMNEDGHINFRSALPTGPTRHNYHAAADGQLGGIMKVYRDWQISGDIEWVKGLFPYLKRSIEYCIRTWDPRGEGILRDPHHTTYDIEFWGPNGMSSSFYLGALTAMVELARVSGDESNVPGYQELILKGVAYLEEHLFNGEYYEQEVVSTGFDNLSYREIIARLASDNASADQLITQEGPKYQYGHGCLSDGVLGVWLAEMCGLKHPLPEEHVKRNLLSIFQNNFKKSLWNHTNIQRPGYALGDEPGLILCTWPRGSKPTLPFVYSDEVWTGIEYQVASHLIQIGYLLEGLSIVKGVRSRFDGHKRNPWNEYESGSYYARAMASYALLPALSGFRYSRASCELSLEPQINLKAFTTFFCTASGWGNITIEETKVKIVVVEGNLHLKSISLTTNGTLFRKKEDVVISENMDYVFDMTED